LLADIFEQIGYQQENPGLRNSFLAGAYELRSGIPQGETAKSASPDVIRAMSTELFLKFLGIRMDSRKAEGMSSRSTYSRRTTARNSSSSLRTPRSPT
jgi:alkyl sulfatase BDS1-like metallo-beta-lactamase superfamily hydrolase